MTNQFSNVNQAIQEIESLIEKGSFQDAWEAALIWEDLADSNVIDEDEAMTLNAKIMHAICQLEEYDEWLIEVEKTIRQSWQTMCYYYIGEQCISEDDSTDDLLEILAEIDSEDRLGECVSWICEDFRKLPCPEARIELFLAIQHRCALAIAYWRGRGMSQSSVYEHLCDTLVSDDIPSRNYSHTADERQKRMGYAAYVLEALLYKIVMEDFQSDHDLSNREAIMASVRRWQATCSKDTIQSYLTGMEQVHTDGSGAYQYKRNLPGKAVLVGSHTAGSGPTACRTYTVPASIDGLIVRRVEHIPDVVCDTLCFEEGIEEIALSGFRGRCRLLILPDSLARIEARSFEGLSELEEVRMNGGVIGEGAFAHCENLKKVHFGPNLRSVLRGAFDGCRHLEQIEFPDSMFAVAECAFRGCGIKKLVLHKIERLARHAFMNCLRLEEVRLTADIENIQVNPFEGCVALSRMEVDEAVRCLKLRDGALYFEKETEISPIFRTVGGPEREVVAYRICDIPYTSKQGRKC